MIAQELLQPLVSRGWHFEPAAGVAHEAERLECLPHDLRRFLGCFRVLSNTAGTKWLWSAEDFCKEITAAEDFSWNSLEALSLEACGNDDTWADEVRRFWSRHTPIMMSVSGDYEYVAYCHAEVNAGTYVHGRGPEFEEVEKVATSLSQLVGWIAAHAS